jgi:restriction system protein
MSEDVVIPPAIPPHQQPALPLDQSVTHQVVTRHVLAADTFHVNVIGIDAALLNQNSPSLTLKALLIPGNSTQEGVLIEAVGVPWFDMLERFSRDPNSIYEIDPRTWEEIIAGAYKRDGWEVELTPRSADKGRDVVATRKGIGSIRIFDQVKAYRRGNLVTAEEVRAMLGVITGAQNVSKGIITTTSGFAPRIMDDAYIASNIPFRIELKDRDALLPWLDGLRSRKG